MTSQPTIREFPACDPRIEDGPVQFGDDWPGLFLRGDTALHFASFLRELLGTSTTPPADPIVLGMLRGLLSDLESCNVSGREKSPPADESTDIKLRPVLERMREMQRTAEAFNAPLTMIAKDYKAIADELERLQRFGVRMLMVHEGRSADEAQTLIGVVDSAPGNCP